MEKTQDYQSLKSAWIIDLGGRGCRLKERLNETAISSINLALEILRFLAYAWLVVECERASDDDDTVSDKLRAPLQQGLC